MTVAPDGPHAIRDGYFNPANTGDQTAGLVQFIADGVSAGGVNFDGPGAWHIDATALVSIPACQTFVFKGQNERRGEAYLQEGCRIVPLNDLPLGSAPKVTPLIDMRAVARPTWDGVVIVQPKVRYTTKGGGIIPSIIGGLGLPGSYEVNHTSIGGVSAPFIEGRTPGTGGQNPQAAGYDHSVMFDVWTDSCAVSHHLLPGANSAGDQALIDCDFGGTQAAFWMAKSSSSGLVGDSLVRVGLYPPIGFGVYDDGSGAAGGQLQADVLSGVSAEFAYTAVYYDQCWNKPGHGSFVGGNVWTPGFYQSPSQDLLGWGQDCTIVSNSGTTLVVTPPAGFEFMYGMVLVDPVNDPYGLTPLATLTVDPAEPWPYSTDNKTFQATLTLSESISLPVGSKVHIMQPKLGTIVAGSIAMEHIQGSLMRNPTGKPVFVAGTSNVHDVVIEDWGSAKALEQVAPLFGGHVGTGNTAGLSGMSVRLGFGVMATGKNAACGEFVCGHVETNLYRYDGTAPARGTVLRTAGVAGGGEVGWQSKASDRNTTAPCVNHTATALAAYSFIKPDPATGGAIPCDQSDPDCCGQVGQTAIQPGTVGQLQALWLED